MTLVHIVTGWSEHGWHRRQFAKDFTKCGLELAADPMRADVIVAHSSGCYSLPKSKARLVMLIDPPYWPGRPLLAGVLNNAVRDARAQIRAWGLASWLRMRVGNTVYAIVNPWHHIKIWRSLKKALDKSLAGRNKLILVRNRDDTYCGPMIAEWAAQKPEIVYHELPGMHEDCWQNPQPYIDLIKKWL